MHDEHQDIAAQDRCHSILWVLLKSQTDRQIDKDRETKRGLLAVNISVYTIKNQVTDKYATSRITSAAALPPPSSSV